MDIAKRLSSLREEKGFSEESLAEALGVELSLIKDWENGNKSPKAENLVGLGRVYSMSIDEIIFSENKIPEYNEKSAVYSEHKVVEKQSAKDAAMVKSAKASMIIFPALLIIVYLCLGIFMNLWHPGWIVLLAIPVYFILVFVLNKIGDNVDKAVEDYINVNEEEEKR